MKCISCGKELVEGVKFCMYCGARQIPVEPAPAEEVVEAVAEPVIEAAEAVEPVVDAETVAEPVPEAVPEPVVEAVPEPVVEAVPEPVAEVAPAPVPVPEPAIEAETQAAAQPAAETVALPDPLDALELKPDDGVSPIFDTGSMAATEAMPVPAPVPAPAPEPAPAAVAAPAKKSKTPIIVAVVAALALLGAGGWWFFQQRALANAYEEAQQLYDAGSYEQAAEAFEALGSYSDSAAKKDLSLQWANAVDQEAAAGEDPAKWEAVAEAYALIDDPDAQAQAALCHDTATFFTAAGLMDQKKWADAQKLFDGLAASGFEGAEARSKECSNWIDYEKAAGLMSSGNYAGALEVFSSLANAGFSDAADRAEACQAWIDYQAAEKLFSEGHFYDAYKAFSAIGGPYEGMPDPAEKAKACIQGFPANGIVYANEAYPPANLDLTIDNSKNTNAYYKLYIGDALVRTVFVRGGEQATFPLPAGTYRMNKGYGDVWFGPDDMFGDEGSYYTCDFGGSDTFELEDGWEYTISSGGDGTGIGSNNADRGSI